MDDRAVRAFLAAIARQGARPPMREIGHTVAEDVRLNFREGRDPDGRPWAPLSPVTVARRRGQSSTPLLDRGILRNSITFAVEGANAVVVGTNVPYGRMQQEGAEKGQFGRTSRGSPIPWGRVPGRRYLGIGPRARRSLAGILERDYSGAAR